MPDLFDSVPERRPQSVSELTAEIRTDLERRYNDVWVEGEITNWMVAASGHAYFGVRDSGALLSCVVWKSAFQKMAKKTFRDGDLVEARGRISVYAPRGQYQLTVSSLKPVGEGALWQKFLEIKARLEAEGLFDPARKRPVPAVPRSIGVVTSPTGAAIRDVLSVLGRRAPGLPVLIWPAQVQGAGSSQQVAHGVRALGASGRVDVIIVTRGGGSMEDLWAFNDEALAREIARCPVPVISAVGHEVDFTIADFVADLRAATPSAAAEIVSREHGALAERARELVRRMDSAITTRLRDPRQRLQLAMSSYALREPENLLREAQQRTDDALARLDGALDLKLERARTRLRAATGALQGHNPELIQKKGFAIVRRAGSVITKAGELSEGDHLAIGFADGERGARVEG